MAYNRIKSERESLGLTQHQLSSLLGVPFRSIQNWEGGQRSCPPYVEKLIVDRLRLLRLLEIPDVSIDDIRHFVNTSLSE